MPRLLGRGTTNHENRVHLTPDSIFELNIWIVGTAKNFSYFIEKKIDRSGTLLIAGVDEVGRGPLAGPVLAAAVVFPPGLFLPGVTDSKRLNSKQRDFLFQLIKRKSVAVGLGLLGPREIDRLNILQASLSAMEQAVSQLNLKPDLVLVDGNRPLKQPFLQKCLIQGDLLSHSIGAASIIAKVVRDKLMESWHYRFPQYNFFDNKGYGTREHLAALRRYGPCPLHRLSFKGTVFGEFYTAG
ncbi:MAG: ribonuclease HII [Deltaproteobacteria bacterium]|nr:ribonuclease HII [Deltaproteobacteria bacterium]